METINDSTGKFTAKVMAIIVAVVVVALIFVPIVGQLTQERIDIEEHNDGYFGVDLSRYELGKSHPNKSINVTLADNTVTFSGDYVGTVSADTDFIIECSDIDSLFVKNGVMYYFDGEKTRNVDSHTIAINGKTVNGRNANYVFFPETDGKFASFDEYQYNVIPVIGVGSFAGMSILSSENTIVDTNLDGFKATVVKDDSGVHGVEYDEI